MATFLPQRPRTCAASCPAKHGTRSQAFERSVAPALVQLLRDNLFGPLALALYPGPFWPVSVALVAKALGAVHTRFNGFTSSSAILPAVPVVERESLAKGEPQEPQVLPPSLTVFSAGKLRESVVVRDLADDELSAEDLAALTLQRRRLSLTAGDELWEGARGTKDGPGRTRRGTSFGSTSSASQDESRVNLQEAAPSLPRPSMSGIESGLSC